MRSPSSTTSIFNNNSTVEVATAAKERTLAAFVSAAVCSEYPAGQAECIRLKKNLYGTCCALLSSYEHGEHAHDAAVEFYLPAHFRFWICICLGNNMKGNKTTQAEAYEFGVQQHLVAHKIDKSRCPDCRLLRIGITITFQLFHIDGWTIRRRRCWCTTMVWITLVRTIVP